MADRSVSDEVVARLLEIERWQRKRIDELQAALDAKTHSEDVLSAVAREAAGRQGVLESRITELEATLRRLLAARTFRISNAAARAVRRGVPAPADSLQSLLDEALPAPVPVVDPPPRIDPADAAAVTDAFHKIYYDDYPRTWENTSWLGTKILKLPLDMWIYQELLAELRPDLIVECGTNRGGSAAYMASVLDLLGGAGRIVTIDIEHMEGRPIHDRVTYLHGSSTDPAIVDAVLDMVGPYDRVLVILDSDHSEKHVREEIDRYHGLVTVGSYLIVEDTNVNGHPVFLHHGPGPMEALEDFLSTNDDFVSDTSREKYYLTFNPRGYLLRVR